MCSTRAITIILKCKIGCKIRQKKYIFYNNVYFFNFFCLCPFLSPHFLLPTSSLLLSLSSLTSYLIKIYLILLVVCYFFVLLHAQIIIANKRFDI